MKYFHRALGLFILFVYFYIMANARELSPEFAHYMFPACELARCRSPILPMSIPPILSAICFCGGHLLSLHFSPRTSVTGERIFPAALYYFIGYLLLILTIFMYYAPLAGLLS